MRVRITALLASTVIGAAAVVAGPTRTWTDRSGHSFEAELIAADLVRATLLVKGGAKTIVPIAKLSAKDAEYLQQWREDEPFAPGVDPAFLPPWPKEAVAESFEVQITGEDKASGSTHYSSPHFAIASDVRLPVAVVRDLAAVLEATRAAVCSGPLGLQPGPEPPNYRVRLFSKVDEYSAAGGRGGTGGTFNGREMLVLLPNLGILPTTNGLTAKHHQQLFVIKHEVVHQLIAPRRFPLPPWFNEGLAETFAAIPYTRGRYTFQNLDSAMRDYLLKWRSSRDSRDLRLVSPAKLMSLTMEEWNAEVASQRAYDLYNSAGLLMHWFLHHDGRGDGAPVASYFLALREGMLPQEAEQTHLLRGRTHAQIATELKNLARRMALDLTIE